MGCSIMGKMKKIKEADLVIIFGENPFRGNDDTGQEWAIMDKDGHIVSINDCFFKFENALEKAKDEKSPLHDYFMWDDVEAAKLWRLAQARCLFNSIEEGTEDEEKE